METLKNLLYAIADLLYAAASFIVDKIKLVIDWFLELNIYNKVIVANTITCFFAITLPIAKYYIFEKWFFINNPVAVYLIFITVLMLASIFFRGQFVAGIRIGLNAWYFIYILYMWAFNSISKAPYVLSKGFVFNLIAPLVYLAVSVLIYLSGEE